MINFDEMIDNYLRRPASQKQEGRYYPSQIGSCMRKTWYSYKFPTETKPETSKIFEVGNMMHDFIVKVLKSDKNSQIELLKSEFPFVQEIDDFIISGRIDDLILVKKENKKILVEVKSSSSVDFVKEPSEGYVMQLQLYLHFFGVDDGLILYLDKRNMKCKSFEIKYDVDFAISVIKRFASLHNYIIRNETPEPEARKKENLSWMCKSCEYREKCFIDTP